MKSGNVLLDIATVASVFSIHWNHVSCGFCFRHEVTPWFCWIEEGRGDCSGDRRGWPVSKREPLTKSQLPHGGGASLLTSARRRVSSPIVLFHSRTFPTLLNHWKQEHWKLVTLTKGREKDGKRYCFKGLYHVGYGVMPLCLSGCRTRAPQRLGFGMSRCLLERGLPGFESWKPPTNAVSVSMTSAVGLGSSQCNGVRIF